MLCGFFWGCWVLGLLGLDNSVGELEVRKGGGLEFGFWSGLCRWWCGFVVFSGGSEVGEFFVCGCFYVLFFVFLGFFFWVFIGGVFVLVFGWYDD